MGATLSTTTYVRCRVCVSLLAGCVEGSFTVFRRFVEVGAAVDEESRHVDVAAFAREVERRLLFVFARPIDVVAAV